MKNLHTKKTSNGSNFGWLIWQMSINEKSGRKTFRRRVVSGSLFVSPCPPECNFQSETKIEPDRRLCSPRCGKKPNAQFRDVCGRGRTASAAAIISSIFSVGTLYAKNNARATPKMCVRQLQLFIMSYIQQ